MFAMGVVQGVQHREKKLRLETRAIGCPLILVSIAEPAWLRGSRVDSISDARPAGETTTTLLTIDSYHCLVQMYPIRS